MTVNGRPARLGTRFEFDRTQLTEPFLKIVEEHRKLRAPSRWLWLAEYRAIWELGFSVAVAPLMLAAPRGDGHPVLVLPGFLADDMSTQVLRAYITALGYDTHGWEMGRNYGGLLRMRASLRGRVRALRQATGRKVSIVGWSLGGVYARMLALDTPQDIRSVISLGSPFSRDPDASNITNLYEFLTGEGPTPQEKRTGLVPGEFDRLAGDLPMPATSIYSRSDGVVNWRCCLLRRNERAENIEVIGASHLGLGFNAAVGWAIADRLAQDEGTFAPFRRGGPFALGYGRPR